MIDTIKLFAIKHRTAVSFATAFVVYAIFTAFYMGGAATNCTQYLLTFPGDNTAGLIAMFSIDNHDPWFGFTNVYSYPYGEVLGQPTHITAQTLFVPFWALAKLFGPVCGFNVLTMLGFMSASLAMFAFVRWLFGRFWPALLAGFAVAFTPYLQIKTGVHISYVFEAFFIATIWLFMAMWQKPTIKKAILLGLSVALFAYTDGYFILLGGVLVAGLLLGALGFDYFKNKRTISKELKQRVKLLGLAAGAAFVFALPVLYVMATSSGQINASLVATRDSIHNEAQVYGARPLEYLVPNPFNPILNKVFGDYGDRNNHGSNPAENVLSLSLTMLALAVYFVVWVYKNRGKKKQLKLVSGKLNVEFITVVSVVVLLMALAFSLPPKLGPIPTPTYFLIEGVALWRVFARLSVIVNIAMIILASGGLIVLLDRLKTRKKQMLLIAAAFVLVFVEYLTFVPPRKVGGYEQVPQIYHWLHSQNAYAEIAEYPLDEFAASGNPVFYDTYQRVHGKKLLNGVISSKEAIFARQAVRDLTNPQAVPGLRALGIDFITVHSPKDPGKIPGLTQRYVSKEPILQTDGKPNKIWGYSVDPGQKSEYAVAPTTGWHAPVKVNAIHQIQEMGDEGVLGFQNLARDHAKVTSVNLQLKVMAASKAGQEISIKQGNTVLWHGRIAAHEETISFTADPRKDVHIVAIKPGVPASLYASEISVVN